ncbi:MAG: hypothetical protein ACRDSK_13685 [Actinophytocola sp.]|uniref:hypothetical protein n=1 Tax=Actinophytocola sp. TaxID=1872138 RepID=UPI003D6A3ED2
MTYAPAKLLEAREYLKPLTGLNNIALGITSDGYGHGYHRGRDAINTAKDYSVIESPRDRSGLSNAASALDIGLFDRTVNGRRVTLRSLSLWLVEQCRAGAPDTRDIREIIYTPDGRVVRRWDRLGVRSSGDDSHLKHTHISYFRDSRDRDKVALFRRFFAPSPPPPAARRFPLAALATVTVTSQEGAIMPEFMIRHSTKDEVFAVWGSGLVRHVGKREYDYYKAQVEVLTTTDDAEHARLLAYSRALQA